MIGWQRTWRSRAIAAGGAFAVFMLATPADPPALAEAVSAPAILQMFEARWDTIEDRMADIFEVGYGQMWLPPPARAETGNFSAGYDVFDRFDLGSPRNETLYGTEASLKAGIAAAHNAGVNVYTDFIVNHNGFANLGTVDNNGTPGDASDDVTFAESGGYPGFVLTLPDDIDGDFHGAFEGGDWNGRLGGLIDIAQEKNHPYIRHPIADDPQNIPAGTAGIFGRGPANLPDPNNARFYPDQAAGGTLFFDDHGDSNPANDEFVLRYDFNNASPLAGDPVVENAMGLLMRNAQWMVQAIGVDGFRIDAAKHVPQWALAYIDRAVFAANPRLNLDGTIQPVFMFGEVIGDNGQVQNYIRKNLANPWAISPGDTVVKGNRDGLDFPLSFALRFGLTDSEIGNNWHNIRYASQDNYDNGIIDGSAGVMFVDNHDDQNGNDPGDGVPFLEKVAYAYTLMRPGNAIVYFNAEEFGSSEFRGFPTDGTDDALGGPVYGDAVARLVQIRNSHGRGDFHERWIDEAFGDTNGDGQKSNIYIYERLNSAIVGLNNRNNDVSETRSGVQTGFAPGTILVELTGNAADPTVDVGDVIPETIKVSATGHVNISVPGNNLPGTISDGRGYVIYGLATPQGALSLTNVADTLAGGTPTAATNGTTLLADIEVIRSDSFGVRLDTTPVSLADPDNPGMFVRDFDADGDSALLRIDGGIDLNASPGVDVTDPADVAYGFENFSDTNLPGFTHGGTGLYEQEIDATQLAEGRHCITVRAFRHRASGPDVFTDFRQTIYIDRLAPEAAIVSFEPYASSPGNPNNRDLIVQSTDQTADNMHIFLDLPAGITPAEVLQMALDGQQDADEYDRDQWIYGFNGVSSGNHVATVVTFEPTFDGTHGYSVRRFAGLYTNTNIGAGFGDLDNDGTYEASDILGTTNGSAEDVLYSQNELFSAAFDVNGDGLGDNRDLFALGDELVVAGAGQAVLDSYAELLLKRGDFDDSSTTNVADFETLYANLGGTEWLFDLSLDGLSEGVVDVEDAKTFVTRLVRSVPGDYNADGKVDAADYTTWRDRLGGGGIALVADGDFDGDVDEDDYRVWKEAYGFERGSYSGGTATLAPPAPEPGGLSMAAMLLAASGFARNRTRIASFSNTTA